MYWRMKPPQWWWWGAHVARMDQERWALATTVWDRRTVQEREGGQDAGVG